MATIQLTREQEARQVAEVRRACIEDEDPNPAAWLTPEQLTQVRARSGRQGDPDDYVATLPREPEPPAPPQPATSPAEPDDVDEDDTPVTGADLLASPVRTRVPYRIPELGKRVWVARYSGDVAKRHRLWCLDVETGIDPHDSPQVQARKAAVHHPEIMARLVAAACYQAEDGDARCFAREQVPQIRAALANETIEEIYLISTRRPGRQEVMAEQLLPFGVAAEAILESCASISSTSTDSLQSLKERATEWLSQWRRLNLPSD